MSSRPVIYAAISLASAIAVVFVLFPGFVNTYSETATGLPAITRTAIDASDDGRIFAWVALFVASAVVIASLALWGVRATEPEVRDLVNFGAIAVAATMLIVVGFFLAAIITPLAITS